MLEALLAWGSGAGGIAVMAYLAKRMLEHSLTGELEQFKHELKTQHETSLEHLRHDLRVEHDRDMERLRSEMRVAAHERETRFSKYHDRQVETLTELHRRLVVAERAYLSAFNGADSPRGQWYRDAVQQARASLLEYGQYLDEYQIFLPVELADELARVVSLLADAHRELRELDPLFEELSEDEEWEHREALSERLAEIAPLRERLRQRVRRLMGG